MTWAQFLEIHPYRDIDSELTKLLPCFRNGFFVSNHALQTNGNKDPEREVRVH